MIRLAEMCGFLVLCIAIWIAYQFAASLIDARVDQRLEQHYGIFPVDKYEAWLMPAAPCCPAPPAELT